MTRALQIAHDGAGVDLEAACRAAAVFIKIPAARQGLPAIAACLAEGISINITLIFSLVRYDAVIEAFLDGLERARQAGRDLASIASVASFFVSRVDTEVDAQLDKIGTPAAAALRGRAAIANARLAYQRYERMLASPRWAALAAAGARPQRPLWASTKLLLATGSAPRRLPVAGAEAAGVHYLRRAADSDQIKAAFQTASRVAVIGAGWIGLETAAAARAAGAEVTILETASLPLLRVLGPEVAQVFAGLHRDHGVDLRLGVQVAEITGSGGSADGVRLADGSHVAADAVIVGVGITPNSQLAADAGLEVRNGVVVDAHLRSSDPDIHAAGDVANAYHPLLARHIRVEHWANALHQPQTAARAMLGQDVVHDLVPYFYTDQYDLGMEYAGYVEPDGYDQVVFRGDVDGREFIAFWLSGGRVLAGMNVNIWDVNEVIQAIVRGGRVVDTGQLADASVPLEEFAG
jgi:3-phenylpropionate/trans-cinnamate dioxygenase ferredoxin reductase component